jgi:hypothetical protein
MWQVQSDVDLMNGYLYSLEAEVPIVNVGKSRKAWTG